VHVVILSDQETIGGAAISCSRLAEGLCALGSRVTRLVNTPDGQEHPWTTKPIVPRYRQVVALNIVNYIFGGRLYERLALTGAHHRLGRALAELRPDVINVHNLHCAGHAGWSPELLRICCRYAPTIWTLHDMWSFTGRCAYAYDCRKFVTGCDAYCQTAEEHPVLAAEVIPFAWKRRQRLFAELPDLVAVCPSRWLAQEALVGTWAGHRAEVIPYGVPMEVYQAIDRELARAALGIEAPGLVLLTVAQELTERRKGGQILIEAMQHVSSRPLTLVTLGHGRLPIHVDGLQVHHLGYIDYERTKVLAYSAADVLVHPAPVDNLPNTIMEAIACGTPCVGFAIGGVPDMVRSGETGWLADEVSAQALARMIDKALGDIRRRLDLRALCRGVAEAEYGLDVQARKYRELFESLSSVRVAS
jgi:glycosyltransferase involved in cell wall biosynthesis